MSLITLDRADFIGSRMPDEVWKTIVQDILNNK